MWHHHPRIRQCAESMQAGGVVAYPTEAVWGLGCDPFNVDAVDKILRLKNRDWEKGLILIAGSLQHVTFLLNGLSGEQIEKLKTSWPGHTTWLLPHKQRIPEIVHGVHSSVAVRVSRHPVVMALCERFGGPIVSTSANPQGKQPAKTLLAARRYFRNRQVCFSPGVTGHQRAPSTIIDLMSGTTLR